MILRNGKHKIQITAVFNVITLNNHLISSDYLDINRSSWPTDSFCKCLVWFATMCIKNAAIYFFLCFSIERVSHTRIYEVLHDVKFIDCQESCLKELHYSFYFCNHSDALEIRVCVWVCVCGVSFFIICFLLCIITHWIKLHTEMDTTLRRSTAFWWRVILYIING